MQMLMENDLKWSVSFQNQRCFLLEIYGIQNNAIRNNDRHNEY